jgi:rhodanese-related sulfurtransferase
MGTYGIFLAAVVTFLVVGIAGVKIAERWTRRAHALVEDGALLLDVQKRHDFKRAHIEGALNIPYDELKTRMRELDRERAVVVYCKNGVRSLLARSLLKSHGFRRVSYLGVMGNWLRFFPDQPRFPQEG